MRRTNDGRINEKQEMPNKILKKIQYPTESTLSIFDICLTVYRSYI